MNMFMKRYLITELLTCLPYLWSKKVHYTLRGYYYFNLHISFLFCSDWRNGALEMVCRDNPPPPFFFAMWPNVHFRVMSSTSKITKRDKQMFLMWTVPITHLRHAFIQCCASFPLLRWEYLYAMAAAIKNMDSADTWPRYQTKKSEGSRVPD